MVTRDGEVHRSGRLLPRAVQLHDDVEVPRVPGVLGKDVEADPLQRRWVI